MLYFVYELIDPRSNIPYYVGCTTNPNLRHRQHLSDELNEKKRVWIQELASAQLEPKMKILEVVEDSHIAQEREKDWIKQRISEGHPLTNSQHVSSYPHRSNSGSRSLPDVDLGDSLLRWYLVGYYPSLERGNALAYWLSRKEELQHQQLTIEDKPVYYINELLDSLPYSLSELADMLDMSEEIIRRIRNGEWICQASYELFMLQFRWLFTNKIYEQGVKQVMGFDINDSWTCKDQIA